MFFLGSGDKHECCGCRACEQICPTACISVYVDDEGFLYPLKDSVRCINCDLCRGVCPCANGEFLLAAGSSCYSRAYMAKHKDKSIVYNSASGGVFSALVSSFCDGEFAVFGVELNDSFEVVHSFTQTISGTLKYRKSKYVQSDIKRSYKKAEEFLKNGCKVLFTGTPCQVAGLRLFLGKDYENLLTADLVCHGVPSQKVFDRYLSFLQQKYGGIVTSYGFRHKSLKWRRWNSRNIRVVVGKKEIIRDSMTDEYLRGFHKSLYYRPSCYECKFANPNRISDFTMADFWGVEKKYPSEIVHRGVSALLANTEKALALVDTLKSHLSMLEVERDFVIQNNRQLQRATVRHPRRAEFFRELDTVDFSDLVDRCVPKPPVIRRVASRVLSDRAKNAIRQIWS